MEMRYDKLLFDLDGTISDPLTGIARCINHALQHAGYRTYTEAELSPFVGPPLDQTFHSITGSRDQKKIKALVEKYRERYADIGYAENQLYQDVDATIAGLHAAGAMMAVCTSKPQVYAEKILERFNLRQYFQFVSGGDIGIKKWQQIAALKALGLVTEETLMIGGRDVDLSAAAVNHLPSAAVLWGYGSLEELLPHRCLHVFHHPHELNLLKDWIVAQPSTV